MSFTSALVALISISMIVVPAAPSFASVEETWYGINTAGETTKLQILPPESAAKGDPGAVYICHYKNGEPVQPKIIGNNCGYKHVPAAVLAKASISPDVPFAAPANQAAPNQGAQASNSALCYPQNSSSVFVCSPGHPPADTTRYVPTSAANVYWDITKGPVPAHLQVQSSPMQSSGPAPQAQKSSKTALFVAGAVGVVLGVALARNGSGYGGYGYYSPGYDYHYSGGCYQQTRNCPNCTC